METRIEHATGPDGATAEVCTIVHGGHEHTALGASIDHAAGRVVGYVSGSALTTWDGRQIGTVREVSSWPTPRSYVSSRMYAFRATVDGRPYHGRGCGEGMILKLRASRVGAK